MKIRIVLVALTLLVVFGAAHAQTIVANPGVKAADISKADLRDIFNGATSNFKDGSRAVPVTLKGGAVHEEFLKTYAGKTDSAFRAAWRSLVFTGQAAMPKAFDTEAALLDYVAATPGAIGYIGKSTPHDKVKALTVK